MDIISVVGTAIILLFALALLGILANAILTTKDHEPKELQGPEAVDEFIAEMTRPGYGTYANGQWLFHPSTDAEQLRKFRYAHSNRGVHPNGGRPGVRRRRR